MQDPKWIELPLVQCSYDYIKAIKSDVDREKVRVLVILMEDYDRDCKDVEKYLENHEMACVLINSKEETVYQRALDEMKLKIGLQILPKELTISESTLLIGLIA